MTNDLFLKYIKNSPNSEVKQTHKQNNPVRKWADDMNRHFTERDIQITNNHIKI